MSMNIERHPLAKLKRMIPIRTVAGDKKTYRVSWENDNQRRTTIRKAEGYLNHILKNKSTLDSEQLKRLNNFFQTEKISERLISGDAFDLLDDSNKTKIRRLAKKKDPYSYKKNLASALLKLANKKAGFTDLKVNAQSNHVRFISKILEKTKHSEFPKTPLPNDPFLRSFYEVLDEADFNGRIGGDDIFQDFKETGENLLNKPEVRSVAFGKSPRYFNWGLYYLIERLKGRGVSQVEIAEVSGVGKGTIANHFKALIKKLNIDRKNLGRHPYDHWR